MKFTEQELDSFIALYKQEFGDDIDRLEAQKQATALVSIVKLTFIPISKKEFNESLRACGKPQI